MGETALAAARKVFERVLARPAPADLWELQKELLVIGEPAAGAHTVARTLHLCLRGPAG